MSDDKDYAHQRDPEAQRTRYELWAIVVIVVVVLVGSIIWRAVEHKPAGPQKGYAPAPGVAPSGVTTSAAPGAAAGVRAAPASTAPAGP